MAKNTCPVCRRPLLAVAVRLWDGRRYCRACVDAACPGLASFAAENPVLELVLPRIKFWRTYIPLLLFMNAGIAAWFGIPMAWFSVVDLNGERVPPGDALAAVAIFMAGVTILITLGFCVVFVVTLFSRGWIRIADGEVEIDSGAIAVEDQLTEISFCIVPRESIGWPHRPQLDDCPAELVVSPRVPSDWRSVWRMEFPLDANALERWTTFLRLAKADILPPPVAVSRRMNLIAWAFTFLAFPLGFIVCMSLPMVLRDLLMIAGMEQHFAGMLAGTVLVLGFPLIFMHEWLRLGSTLVRETGLPFRTTRPKRQRAAKWIFAPCFAAFVGLLFLREPIGWPAYGAFVTLWFVLSWLFCWSVEGIVQYLPRRDGSPVE